jgi:hypothetical protein
VSGIQGRKGDGGASVRVVAKKSKKRNKEKSNQIKIKIK